MGDKKLKDGWSQTLFLMENHQISHVFDVGANAGQYSNRLLDEGYRGKITSFEPLQPVHQELLKSTHRHPHWNAAEVMAIGGEVGETEINVSPHSDMSSLLDMTSETKKNLSSTQYSGTQKVRVETIDSIIDTYSDSKDRIYLKVDTQGFEYQVLLGAEKSLSRIVGVQLEMSLKAMYEGEKSYKELIQYLEERDFILKCIKPGYFCKHQKQMLQIDGIFYKAGSAS